MDRRSFLATLATTPLAILKSKKQQEYMIIGAYNGSIYGDWPVRFATVIGVDFQLSKGLDTQEFRKGMADDTLKDAINGTWGKMFTFYRSELGTRYILRMPCGAEYHGKDFPTKTVMCSCKNPNHYFFSWHVTK